MFQALSASPIRTFYEGYSQATTYFCPTCVPLLRGLPFKIPVDNSMQSQWMKMQSVMKALDESLVAWGRNPMPPKIWTCLRHAPGVLFFVPAANPEQYSIVKLAAFQRKHLPNPIVSRLVSLANNSLADAINQSKKYRIVKLAACARDHWSKVSLAIQTAAALALFAAGLRLQAGGMLLGISVQAVLMSDALPVKVTPVITALDQLAGGIYRLGPTILNYKEKHLRALMAVALLVFLNRDLPKRLGSLFDSMDTKVLFNFNYFQF